MDSYRLYPSTLINRGVSCWLNSIVQGLVSCPNFCQVIRKNIKKNMDNEIYHAFYSFMSLNQKGLLTDECSVRILESLNRLNRESMNSVKLAQNQMCSLDFLENVIEALHDPEITDLFTSKYVTETICTHCSKATCILTHHFYIGLKKTELPDSKKYARDIVSRDIAIDAWKCPQCSLESFDIKSTSRLITCPKICIVQFDKINNTNVVSVTDHFELSMTVGNYMRSLQYNIVSTICHYGPTTGGCYIANCLRKNPSDDTLSWYKLNDQNLSQENGPLLDSSDIFMTIYMLNE